MIGGAERAKRRSGLAQDTDVQSALAAVIVERATGAVTDELRVGPLQRNYFSILFTLDASACPGWMVKIPKTDLRPRPDDGILPVTNGDRALAYAEYESLTRIEASWRGEDVLVSWVRAVDFIDEYNAIVTQRVAAHEVWDSYRRLALWHLLGNRSAGQRLAGPLSRFGIALSRFHDQDAVERQLAGSSLVPRLRSYFDRIRAAGARLPSQRRTDAVLDCLASRRWTIVETTTFKGIDIRNMLEDAGGRLWLVDPGKIKVMPREADLARFLMTWRILFWGTPWFALGLAPHGSIEAAFLAAYDQGRPRDESPLAAFMLKELLKHWATAYDSLALKRWSSARRRLVAHRYIDPFYRRQMDHLLRTLG